MLLFFAPPPPKKKKKKKKKDVEEFLGQMIVGFVKSDIRIIRIGKVM